MSDEENEPPLRGGHPLQPVVLDARGVPRFKANEIVRFLLDLGPFNMNDLAARDFSTEDQEQFAQLIGYSVGGFSELSYVSDAACEEAEAAAKRLAPQPSGSGS